MDDPVESAILTPLPERFARGWHCMGLERDFAEGEPRGIEAFGTKLMFCTDSGGAVHVSDVYCRHVGGDLLRGSWFSCRQNGMVFVWHDPEGNPPPDEVAIPRIAEFYDDGWSDWSWDRWTITNSHSREIVENLADCAHFFYVHDGFPVEFRNVFEGHTATQYLTSKGRMDSDLGPEFANLIAHSESTYFGPAYVVTNLHSDFNGFVTEAVLVACHYPLTRDSVVLQSGVMAKIPDGIDTSTVEGLRDMIVSGVNEGFVQDINIFQTKARLDKPVLCDGDGPVYQLRRWYEQFYVDVADITAEMTDPFERDIDLSYSAEVWARQERANMAQTGDEIDRAGAELTEG